MRIMFSHRDPEIKGGTDKIFIKNLDSAIDKKTLLKTFSVFGKIVSCKVARNGSGQSKGHAFVQFNHKNASESAIKNINGKVVNGKQIYVGPFIPRIRRNSTNGSGDISGILPAANLFIKNLDKNITEARLKDLFSEFGTIISCKIMVNQRGRSTGAGFVAFSTIDEAAKAMNTMNGKRIGPKPLHVAVAEPKEERRARLQAHNAQIQAPYSMFSPPQVYHTPMQPQWAGYWYYPQFFVPIAYQQWTMPNNTQGARYVAHERIGASSSVVSQPQRTLVMTDSQDEGSSSANDCKFDSCQEQCQCNAGDKPLPPSQHLPTGH